MPIYEYGCPDCGQRIEHMQKISDPLLSTCPQCGSTKIRKLVSQTSFSLKGSGWYSDHYGLRSGSDSGSKATSDSASSTSASVKPSAPSGSDSGSSGGSTPSGGGSAPPASGGSSPAGGSSASATG